MPQMTPGPKHETQVASGPFDAFSGNSWLRARSCRDSLCATLGKVRSLSTTLPAVRASNVKSE